jgi:hypothetical protein
MEKTIKSYNQNVVAFVLWSTLAMSIKKLSSSGCSCNIFFLLEKMRVQMHQIMYMTSQLYWHSITITCHLLDPINITK